MCFAEEPVTLADKYSMLTTFPHQGRAVNPRTPEHSGVDVPTPELFWGWILFCD